MAAVVPPNLGPQCRAMGVTPRPQSSLKAQGTPRPHSPQKFQGTLRPQSSPKSQATPSPNCFPKPQGTPLNPEGGEPGRDSGRNSSQSESTSSVRSVPNEALSGVQVDQAIARGVQEKQGILRAAFRALDTEGNFTVTKGEFRRVIEGFILPLTQPQFTALLAKAPRRENGSVAYTEFLRRHCRTPTARSRFHPRSRQQPMTLKELQHCLRDKIGNNLKNVIRAFRLFDHNRDGKIQKHELLRVLESYCLPLGNQEFHRIWSHYSPDNPGTMSYRDFLQRLSIDCENNRKSEHQDTVKSALNWDSVSQDNERQLQDRTPPVSVAPPSRGLTLEQVHDAFLNKMRLSYDDVWRALQVSDVTCSGVVSQEDLKSILSHFLFPMSDFLFQGLASRFGLNAAEPVQWAQFMAQFKDLAQNKGQTSPVSRGHCEQQGPGTAQQNLQSLQALQEVYPLLKSSVLKSDKGGAGKVTRAELRRLLEGRKCRLTEQQFKELMILLDPEHTGVIHCERILELLHPPPVETQECSGSTQELQQKYKLTESDAWSTVEGLLRDKLSEHLDQVMEALKNYDRGHNGTVHQNELREVINRYGLPVSEGHFYRLCEPHTDSGRLAYGRFLNSLGVSKRNRETDSAAKAQRATSRPSVRSVRTLAVENTVLRKLRENLALRNITIGDCLLETGGNTDGTLSLKHFRRMLENCGIPLGQEEFDVLTEALGFKDGTLSHADFLVKYEDKRATELNNDKQARFLTAEECLSQMKERIEKHHGDILTAFLLIDRNRDGVIDRGDVRRLIDSLVFVTKEQEYQRMLDLLGLKPGATLNYTEFHSTIQACSQPPGPLPLSNKSKQFVEEAGEQVHSHLVSQARRGWSEMAKAFAHSDEEGNGLVFKKDLRELLYSYALPITANQFEKVWSRYDGEGRGVLTHSEFLEKLGVAPESSGRGHSRQTAEERSDSQALATAGSVTPGPQLGPRPEPVPQRESVEHLSPEKAMLRVREEVTTSYHTLHKAFSALDRSGRGTVSTLEFRRVLDHFCVRLSDRQLTHLLADLPIREEDHSVPWRAFLERFRPHDHEMGTVKTADVRLGKVEKMVGSLQPRPLPLSDILERIREVVCARIYTVAKEMADLDYAHINFISKEDFKIFCDRHFMRLTPEQFESLWKQLPVNEFGNLEYKEFLKRFSGDSGGEPQSLEGGEPRAHSGVPTTAIRRCRTAPCTIGRTKSADGEEPRGNASAEGGGATPLQSFDALDRTVRRQIRGCWRDVQRRCRDEDAAGSGGIGTDRFLAILQDLSVRMTRSELEQLALKYGVALNGRIPYADFLRQLLLSLQPRPVTAFHRPKVPLPRTPVNMGVLTGPCADAMLRMLSSVRRLRRPMRQSFVACDPLRTGQISIGDLKQVLGQYGISLSQDEVFHLTSYFDKNLSGKISYNHFLHTFLQ
ncbi:EF-hand calcium-binding domain-containing protein 6 isoform X1 [Anguilla anguilla]|uniref:EF-hand calcium-binding domain-containing protein 6 isoform X1 n=1 Tax=Anguilla anguilla TaxID=7936 RepID=UPI0015B35941|nr:EF-hand calcium-binding domain-containing protein 6 isoform X1 [Anguilla anguilla]